MASRHERTIAAFNAGIDVMLWPGEDYFDLMTDAVESGAVSMERLDESVMRILRFKEAQGLFQREDQEYDTAARGFA